MADPRSIPLNPQSEPSELQQTEETPYKEIPKENRIAVNEEKIDSMLNENEERAAKRKAQICRQFMPFIAEITIGGFSSLISYIGSSFSDEYKNAGSSPYLIPGWSVATAVTGTCIECEISYYPPRGLDTVFTTALTTFAGAGLTYAYSMIPDAPSNSYTPLIIHTATGAAVSLYSFFSSRSRREAASAEVALLPRSSPRS